MEIFKLFLLTNINKKHFFLKNPAKQAENMIVSETGTIMNFTTYLKNAIAKNGSNPYVFGSLTQNATDRLNNLSMFSSASEQDIAGIDLKALLAAVEAADVDVEGATGDQKALNDILKAFLEIKDVQQAADADGDGKLIWECPNCSNRDQSTMNVARRTCGYIGTQYWNQGRTQEIRERVLHL